MCVCILQSVSYDAEQAMNHYLMQSGPRSTVSYGVTRLQRVNSMRPSDAYVHQQSNHHCIIGRRQAIIWTNAGILLIEPLETNFSEIVIKIHIFSLKKTHLKMSAVKWRPFFLGLNVLKDKKTKLISEIAIIGLPFKQASWAPSQYKDRLTYVWRFPC